jgi:hypothetical protein
MPIKRVADATELALPGTSTGAPKSPRDTRHRNKGSEPNGTKISPTGGKFMKKASLDDTVKFPKLIDHPRSQP